MATRVRHATRRRAPAHQPVVGPAIDLVEAKLLRPRGRQGFVSRAALIDRLASSGDVPVVSVVAPAGYGKTTALSQWAAAESRPTVWLSVDETDNDPKVLLSYLAAGLDAVEPIDRRLFGALASPGSSVPGSVVPRLWSAWWSMREPVSIVLDDAHVLTNSETRAAVSVLAEHVPEGSQLVISGRSDPPVRVARLRTEGRVLEIGPQHLSLSFSEASALLRTTADVTLGEDEVRELHRRTEGWPAGLYLAALCLREGGSVPRAVASFGGDDQLISDYMESEFLARISPQQRRFLVRTSVLERMSGPLCDAVLDLPGAHGTLADLARANLMLVRLDRRKEWYRYHHLLRDMLLAELHRVDSDLVPELQRRAADWCLRNDLPDEALEYSMAAGDVDAVARLVERLWLPAYRQARITTVQRWFGWLEDRDAVGRYPMIAVTMSFLATMTGRAADAERWADAVDRWQAGADLAPEDAPAEAWAAMLRAILCRHGIERMAADADEATERFAALDMTELAPVLYQGLARIYSGDPGSARTFFRHVVSAEDGTTTPETVAVALGELALLAIGERDWASAESLSEQAGSVLADSGFEGTFVSAVRARVALHQGDLPKVRSHLLSAQRTRVGLSHTIPHLAVQARLELIRIYLALADPAAARTLLREIREVLVHRPDLGVLVDQVAELHDQLESKRVSIVPRESALTGAELRLLPLLCTHLSFPEIAQDLFLSGNTIKAQAKSIYRKLGASSRSEAVARARELGLLEG